MLEAQRVYEAGGTLDMETRLRYQAQLRAGGEARASKRWIRCTRWPARTASTTSYPLQRMFRDAHAAAGHFSFSTDAQFTPWGLVALGGEFKSPTL